MGFRWLAVERVRERGGKRGRRDGVGVRRRRARGFGLVPDYYYYCRLVVWYSKREASIGELRQPATTTLGGAARRDGRRAQRRHATAAASPAAATQSDWQQNSPRSAARAQSKRGALSSFEGAAAPCLPVSRAGVEGLWSLGQQRHLCLHASRLSLLQARAPSLNTLQPQSEPSTTQTLNTTTAPIPTTSRARLGGRGQ